MAFSKSALIFVVFTWAIVSTLAQNSGPSTVFTEQDAASVKSLLLAAQNKDGTFKDVKTAHQVVSSLHHLNAEVPQKQAVCTQAKQALSNAADVESVYHAVSVAEFLGCGEAASPKVISVLTASLGADNLAGYFYAVKAIAHLNAKKHITPPTEALAKVADKLTDLEDEGLFRSSTQAKEGDAFHAGLAYQTMATIHSLGVPITDDAIDALVDNVGSLLETAEEAEDTLSFSDEGVSDLESTAAVLRGLIALHGVKAVEITEDQIVAFAEFFVGRKSVINVADAHHVLQGLATLSDNKLFVPLALTVTQGTISSSAKGAEGEVKVKVTNVLGKFAVKAKVDLAKAVSASDVKIIVLTNQNLAAASTDAQNTVYTLPFLGTKPEPGFYNFEFKVAPVPAKDDAKHYVAISSVVRPVKVTTSATVTNFEVAVTHSKDEDDDTHRVSVDQPAVLPNKLKAQENDFIHISFKLKNTVTGRGLNAHQAFVKFTNNKNKTEAIVLPKVVNKKHKLVVDIAATEDFNKVSGDYDIEVIVGDAALQAPILWKVGTVSLSFTSKPETKPNPFQPLPEIKHVFRPAEPRPAQSVSSAFTLAVFAPVLVLLGLLAKVGINFRGLPGGTDFLFAFGFIGCIGALLGLIGAFWVGLFNLVATLGYLCGLAVVTVFIGHRALGHLAAVREKRE